MCRKDTPNQHHEKNSWAAAQRCGSHFKELDAQNPLSAVVAVVVIEIAGKAVVYVLLLTSQKKLSLKSFLAQTTILMATSQSSRCEGVERAS